MIKAKLYLFYYQKVTRYNITITVTVVLMCFGGAFAFHSNAVLLKLVPASLTIMGTFGTIAGLYLYHYFRRNEYVFYYNKGISLHNLIFFTVILNIFFLIIGLLIYKKAISLVPDLGFS